MRRTASAWENPHCLCKLYFSHLKALSHSHSVWQKEGEIDLFKTTFIVASFDSAFKILICFAHDINMHTQWGEKGCNFSPYNIFFRCLCLLSAEWAIPLCSFPTYMSTFVFFPFPRTDQTSKCFASEFDWWISHSKPARMKTSTHLLYLTKSQILQRALGLKKASVKLILSWRSQMQTKCRWNSDRYRCNNRV